MAYPKKKESLKVRFKKLYDDTGYHWNEENSLKLLSQVKRAVGGKGKIFAQVGSVSRSGMSRTITLAIIKKNEFINLNHTPFAKIYGDSVKNGRVRICGCGMDMLFEATYRLYQFLFDQNKKPYQNHLVRYSSF